jgi:hypothetical protein
MLLPIPIFMPGKKNDDDIEDGEHGQKERAVNDDIIGLIEPERGEHGNRCGVGPEAIPQESHNKRHLHDAVDE